MYSDSDLDSAPPQSQFRRPWSPELNVPSSSNNNTFRELQREHYGRQAQQDLRSRETSPPRQSRREASDVSVEALDLADYARTLRIRQAEDPYPPFPSEIRQQIPNAPSSFPSLIPGAVSSDTYPWQHHLWFLADPLFPQIRHTVHIHMRLAHYGDHSHFLPHLYLDLTPLHLSLISMEVLVSIILIRTSPHPRWSRNWYNGQNPSANLGNPGPELDADIYTPLPPSHFQSARTRKSIFDPGYVQDSYNPYEFPQPPLPSATHSSREMLPWSNDHVEYGPTLDPVLKEERMRMLEREFGDKAKNNGKNSRNALVDEDGKPLIGTIDEKGHLVTVGPIRRVVLRALQVMLAAAACIPAIYAALVIKATNPRIHLHQQASHPLLCSTSYPRKEERETETWEEGQRQMGPPGAQDVQVNLIVDPTAFQPPDASESESDEENEDEEAMPGSYGQYDNLQQKERRKRRNRQRRRRGIFEGLAMEEQWRTARSWAKTVAMVDVAGLVFWGAAFVFIMIGKRCPSGGFNGWCNAYNVSTASACLLAVSFGIGTFFDVQDLHASKQSPRTRT
ncbi:hypothetical protein BJ912DRAFT_1037562 [Pholiota molesta]|nr:hypothetical protein BJ912DRAFT_1037562 [Pholiota molesta]